MMKLPADLRIIGTGYEGKEPLEYTADVLRAVSRLGGSEFGFETCMTSRPFTAWTFVAAQPGVIRPGRTQAVGAERANLDMVDGLRAIASAGFTVMSLVPGTPPPGNEVLVIAGPLLVPHRWAPGVDQMVLGEVWRHVIVDQRLGGSLVCLDPVFGGFTALPSTVLEPGMVRQWLVHPPPDPASAAILARHCLRVGASWRAEASGDHDRDGPGLAKLEERVRHAAPRVGTAANRLRLSLAGHALHATRWGGLLGWCAPLTMNELALADLLYDTVLWCRTAEHALASRDLSALCDALRNLAELADAVTELCQRADELDLVDQNKAG